jgi:subtilisin family serine protease
MITRVWILIGGLLLAQVSVAQPFRPAPPVASTAAQRTPVLVTVRNGSAKRLRDSRDSSAVAMRIRTDVDRILSALPAAARAHVTHRFGLVPAFAMNADAATIARLRLHPAVARVEPDIGGGGASIRQAPDAASALNRVDLLDGHGMTGKGMKIAVIDTGVDTDHPDLAGRIVGQQCFCTVGTGCCPNGAVQQSGAGSAEDDNGHGTHVAGIIAGNGTVAPRGALPQSSLVAVKVMDRSNRFRSTADVIAALDWVAQQHPDIDAVNMSLGTDALFEGDCENAGAWTESLGVAVRNLNALGAVVVASSGNQRSLTSMAVPACIGPTFSLAATWDFNGGAVAYLGCTETQTVPMAPTCFSNRSAATDLFAAGAFVTATGLNGGILTIGGTSMAAPMAAACAVALKQVAPLSTVQQRSEAMRLSQTRIDDPASGRQYPFLDCFDAAKLMNPTIANPLPREGSMPLLPPRAGTNAAGRSADRLAPSTASPQRKSPGREAARRIAR